MSNASIEVCKMWNTAILVIERLVQMGHLFILFILLLLLAVMTYNQVHYFRVNHLADFTQNGHTKIPVG